MFEQDLSLYAFKNGYKQAIAELLKEEWISVELANKMLKKYDIDPFSN